MRKKINHTETQTDLKEIYDHKETLRNKYVTIIKHKTNTETHINAKEIKNEHINKYKELS